ncbi:MAG: DMT family transporter [Marinosulfonomonas sp.]|nr:DMT family transporter [Marinosulfonomonas sp.]
MSQPASHPVKAAMWMVGTLTSFTAMAVAGREMASEHDPFEILMFRSLVGLMIVLVVGGLAGTLRQINTSKLHIHLVRNSSHFVGQGLWFLALGIAPLAQIFALEFTMPIWALFLAVIVLGERLTRVRVETAIIGFIGILIVTRPWAGGLSIGIIAAAFAAIGFAGAVVFTRLLTRTETITSILFWLTAIQLVLGAIFAGIDGDITMPSASTAPWLVLIGCAGLAAHFCMTKALSLAPASVATPVDFARLPVIAVIGMVFYDEPLQAGVLIGAVIIFAANYRNILTEMRLSRQAAK